MYKKYTNSQNIADRVDFGQATWHAGNFYYQELANLWESSHKTLLYVNDTEQGSDFRLINLQSFFDVLRLQYNMIQPLIDDENLILEIDGIVNQVNEISQGTEFLSLEDEPVKLHMIREKLLLLHKTLWSTQFKYGMMMPQSKKKDFAHVLL